MMQNSTALVTEDPSAILELIAEVDAIFCTSADVAVLQGEAPPAVGSAEYRPRRVGRSWRNHLVRLGHGPVWRVDPMQRSPPPTRKGGIAAAE